MASSASTEQDEEQQIEEDEGKDDKEAQLRVTDDAHTGDPPALCNFTAKKDNCGIIPDSFSFSNSKEEKVCDTKSPPICLNDADMKDSETGDLETNDADMNDSECPYDTVVPRVSSEPGTEKVSSAYPHEVELMETKSINRHLIGKVPGGADLVNRPEKTQDEMMSIDRDELYVAGNNSPMTCSVANLGIVASNNSSSPGAKRITIDDGDESPKPKRQTPDRSDDRADKEETGNNWKDVHETNAAESDHTTKDLPNLSSDSDDDDDDIISTPASQRRHLRRRHLRRRRFGRQRLSSDESDTTEDDDDDTNDGVKNTDEDEGKESDEEVWKAVLEILNKPVPKPNWFAVPELRKREYGYTYHQSSNSFREHVQGSLQMVKRLVLMESMKGHEGCVNALSFNRIGTLLASGSDDLNIVLWNWQRARPSLIYDSGHRSNVFQAKFMPFSGDCHVISCARDGQVRLAELSLTGVCKATRKLAQHRGAAHKLALELDSANIFLSCGEDAVTYLFDLRQEKPHKLVTTKESEKKVPLYSIHSNPCDSRQFCVGGRDHYIRVYDKRKISEDIDGGVLKKFCPDHLVNSEVKANVTCSCYNYNGTEILASYNDEDIYLFDNTMSDGANYVHKYTGHRNNATVKGVNFYGPKSEFIVSGSDCGHVYFWDKETEAIINFQEGDDAGVINVLEPHPTLPVLATSGLDHDVKLWMPSQDIPQLDMNLLKKTLRKNHKERSMERVSAEPEMIGGQMLWFIMHHFRNSARRRMREEGQELSTSDDDNESHSEDSDTNEMQCAQS